jgi:hypothetical protein
MVLQSPARLTQASGRTAERGPLSRVVGQPFEPVRSALITPFVGMHTGAVAHARLSVPSARRSRLSLQSEVQNKGRLLGGRSGDVTLIVCASHAQSWLDCSNSISNIGLVNNTL